MNAQLDTYLKLYQALCTLVEISCLKGLVAPADVNGLGFFTRTQPEQDLTLPQWHLWKFIRSLVGGASINLQELCEAFTGTPTGDHILKCIELAMKGPEHSRLKPTVDSYHPAEILKLYEALERL